MKHTFAGKSAALSRLPVCADARVQHMWLCVTHTHAHKAPERQTFSSLGDEMWNQATMAAATLPSPTRVCLPSCIVEKCLVWFLAAGNPTMGPVAVLRSNDRTKFQLKRHRSSEKHVFKPKLAPSNMTSTHGLWLGSTLDVSLRLRQASCGCHLVLFCFFHVFSRCVASKRRETGSAQRRGFTAQQVHDCVEQRPACLQKTRDGSISVCRSVGARARLTRSLKRS